MSESCYLSDMARSLVNPLKEYTNIKPPTKYTTLMNKLLNITINTPNHGRLMRYLLFISFSSSLIGTKTECVPPPMS